VPSPVEVIIGTPLELAEVFCTRLSLLESRALAVPGGSVAEQFFPALAVAELDWRRLHLFWCDERAVPPEHPDSNYHLAAELLLGRAPIDPANVHRMKGEMPISIAPRQSTNAS
jgi:6-phosphogluconolactonase/glucosamine-6-phosphate isomerase/deaminase